MSPTLSFGACRDLLSYLNGGGMPRFEKRKAELERAIAPRRIKAKHRPGKRDETATIRAAVFERADGVCERCMALPAAELHHVFGRGAGRPPESERNTVALCWTCHHVAAHQNEHDFLRWFAEWAERRGFHSDAGVARRRLTGMIAIREAEKTRLRGAK